MSEGVLSAPVGPEDHAVGPQSAPITLVEYGDYQCPYCGQAYPVVQALAREFGDDLRLVFRNLPLSNVHPHAMHAAEAAEAVARQGMFWPMHDTLYEHQRDLTDRALLTYAQDVGADTQAVEQLLERHATAERIQNDVDSALRSGANGTPAFFVNGRRYDGSWDFDTFSAHLRTVAAQA